jgi:hypothetical protein
MVGGAFIDASLEMAGGFLIRSESLSAQAQDDLAGWRLWLLLACLRVPQPPRGACASLLL